MSDAQKVVETQEIRIVDADGRVRGRFGMVGRQSESVGLHLLRSDGSVAVRIELNEGVLAGEFTGFPKICLLDKAGKERLSLTIGNADDEEYSGLSVNGSDGEARVTLVVPPYDYGEISVIDHKGHTKFIQ